MTRGDVPAWPEIAAGAAGVGVGSVTRRAEGTAPSKPVRIEPFRVGVADDVLADLRARLLRARWPDELPGAGWDHGTSTLELSRVVDAWGRFDWRSRERALNALPQFVAEIDDQRIHFVHCHARGREPAVPVILTHGWPSTFVEMLPLVDRLCDPLSYGGDPADAFDVVVPSLPGYGFSAIPKRPLVNWEVAEMWHRLMSEGLGYATYGAHGVDIGGGVTTRLGFRHPSAVLGLHLASTTFLPPIGTLETSLSDAERAYLSDLARWDEEEGAYSRIQGTKPQTLAYGLNDSPVGQAAWMIEKYRAWSDCHGDLASRFNDEVLLTNLTIYWATATVGSSMRFYYEHRHHPRPFFEGERVMPPVAIADFAHEFVPMPHPPRALVARTFNVTRWTSMPRGGHFPAIEEPDLLASDLRAFFRPLRAQL